jgi:Fibronectin type III domain
VRTIVWVGLGILVLNALLVGALAYNDIGHRFRVARSRRHLQHVGRVVMLPSAAAIRRKRAKAMATGLAVAAVLILGLVRVASTPAAHTDAAAGDPLLQGAPTGTTDGSLGAGAGHSARPPHAAAPAPSLVSAHPTDTATASSPASTSGDAGGPSTVAAVPTSSTSIRLAWAPVSHASGYGIERSTDAVRWRSVGSTHEGQTSYADVALLSGTTYYYRVVALVDGGEEMRSDTVTVTTTTDSGPPVFISATSSATIVDLAWSDVDGETGYRLERSPDGTTGWETIGTTGQGETSFTDEGLASSTAYYYRVFATRADGESPPSTVISATTDPDLPSTPQGDASTHPADTPSS